MYRIFNTETGLYYKGGNDWSKKGKVYTQRNHLTAALTWYAEVKCRFEMQAIENELEKKARDKYGNTNEFWSYYLQLRKKHQKYQELEKLRKDTKRMREKYIPSTWVIEELIHKRILRIHETKTGKTS